MTSQAGGLRERKKAASRLAISKVATKMFMARGFDNVTVAEVAAVADVSVATIFNYFPTKEDLFFDLEAELIEAHARFVRDRKKGESITQALHREFRAVIAAALPPMFRGVSAFFATIDASAALRARLRLAMDKAEATLAAAMTEGASSKPNDPAPLLIAAMVMAIEHVLLEKLRAHLSKHDSVASSKRSLLQACDTAFELLASGAGSYGKRAR